MFLLSIPFSRPVFEFGFGTAYAAANRSFAPELLLLRRVVFFTCFIFEKRAFTDFSP